MTMIAFATHPDRAEVISDTCGYTLSSRHITFGHRKVNAVPGHTAVITSIGSTFYGETLRQVLNRVAADLAGFDELVDRAADVARDVWDHVDRLVVDGGRTRGPRPTDVYLIGYSEHRARFRAVCLSSALGFDVVDVDDHHVRPSPLDRRPSDIETIALARTITEQAWPEVRDASLAKLDELLALDAGPAPQTVNDWVALARSVRRDRAVVAPLFTGYCVYVAGDVELTTITADGDVTVDVVHRFDDTGDEWQQMVALSLHPDSQLAPCACGSGIRYVDCCLDIDVDEPCPCASGDPFGGCCQVSEPSDLERRAWIDHDRANVDELCAEMAATFLTERARVPAS